MLISKIFINVVFILKRDVINHIPVMNIEDLMQILSSFYLCSKRTVEI